MSRARSLTEPTKIHSKLLKLRNAVAFDFWIFLEKSSRIESHPVKNACRAALNGTLKLAAPEKA